MKVGLGMQIMIERIVTLERKIIEPKSQTETKVRLKLSQTGQKIKENKGLANEKKRRMKDRDRAKKRGGERLYERENRKSGQQ